LRVVADAAEADPPLEVGDRVRVEYEGTVTSVKDADWPQIQPDDHEIKDWRLEYRERVTRLEDDPPEFETDDEFAARVAAGEPDDLDQMIAELPSWTPEDGQLVERISDGECFRLMWAENPEVWELDACDGSGGIDRDEVDLLANFRPRYLRIGDVVESFGSLSDRTITGMLWVSLGRRRLSLNNGPWINGYPEMPIVGLGPVPWPPKEETR